MSTTSQNPSLWDASLLGPAIKESFRKLAPRQVAKNPVMFVVEVGSLLTTVLFLRDLVSPPAGAAPAWFTGAVSAWLWFTVVFANFVEVVVEGRGKVQVDSLWCMRI